MNADKLADALRTILDHVDGYVPNTPKAIWRDAQAALAEHDAQPAQSAQPVASTHGFRFVEGWVLVPREPTKQMLAAEDDAVPPKESFDDGGDPFAWGRVSWSAMLAAAPQPPAQPSADAEVSNEMVLRAVHASLDWPHPLTHFEARKALEAAMAKESDAARAAEGGE